MENNDLQNLWKNNIDRYIADYSKEDLKNILVNKAKNSIRGLYSFEILSVVCGVFSFFLVIASINHKNDIAYVINNILLIAIMVFALVGNIWSYQKMNDYKTDEPLKKWLKIRISYIEKSINYNLAFSLPIPILLIMINISTMAYIKNMSFVETIFSPAFLLSLLISFALIIPINYFGGKRQRKKGMEIIQNLKEIYNQIEE